MAAWKPRIKALSLSAGCNLALLGLFGATAWAQSGLDYRSIGTPSTVFYNGPSLLARKISVASRYYPVEVLINSGDWAKVRDSAGELAWVEAKSLSAKRMIIVTTASATVRQKPDLSSIAVAQLERNVVVEFVELTPGWVKVRHKDGLTGYLAISDGWGA